MKKSAKAIIGLGAAVAVLGGGLAALVLTDPKTEEPDVTDDPSVTDEDVQRIIIHDEKASSADPDSEEYAEGVVKTVDVKNADDLLHVVQKTGKTDESAATYTLDGYQDVNMNTSVIGTLANNANELTCEAVIEENCSDLAKFGLASPVITVDITFESGTKKTLLLGNEAPSGDATYAMVKGDNTVYTVRNSAVANYSKTILEFVDKTILDVEDSEIIVNDLRIQRKDLDYDIYLEYVEQDDSVLSGGTSFTHIMKEPTEAYLSVERATDITSGMFGLYATDVYSVHCEESDIAEAGLLDPFCTVSMNCDNGNDYKLLLSESFSDDDNVKCCYAMMEDANVIFIVKAESAPWVDVQPVDIASRIFIASYVWSVPELEVSFDGKDYKMSVERVDPDAEIESLKSTDFKATLNGKEINAERYRQFYSYLLSAYAESFAIDEKIPSGEPMAAIRFTDSYNKRDYDIEFYDFSSMKALIVINGESKFLITKSYIETLKKNAELIDSEEDFITTWK